MDWLPHLLRPWWLLGLLPLLAVLPWLLRDRTLADPWRRVIDHALLTPLRSKADTARTRTHVPLLAFAWAVAVCALAGPSWTHAPTPVHRPGGALVVLLDLSLSMYANDVPPSRIARARQEVQDLVQQFAGGRVALIAYAGDAHVVTPLTDDARTLTNLLASLQPAVMPLPGSNLADALTLAKGLLRDGGETEGAVVVVTDEVASAADLTAFEDPRFPISVLGIGSEAGAPIPLDDLGQPGRYLTDPQGVAILPRLDPERLAQVARLGGGVYATARPDDSDTRAVLGAVRAGDGAAVNARAASARLSWRDQGHWLVLLLVPLCAYAFRRGVVIALCCLALLPPPAQAWEPFTRAASAWTDLWWRRDQQAEQALNEGRADEAARLYTDPRGRATALYRSGRYADAAKLYREDQSADGQYNLGNALARAGQTDAAIAAYDRALRLQPDHADAQHNRALLQRKRQQAKDSGQPNSGTAQRRGKAPEAKPKDDGSSGDGDRRADQQRTADAQARSTAARDAAERAARARSGQSPTERQTAQQTAERQRATEQWLRRVPDQPGRLLQNKFETESALRIQRGESPQPSGREW